MDDEFREFILVSPDNDAVGTVLMRRSSVICVAQQNGNPEVTFLTTPAGETPACVRAIYQDVRDWLIGPNRIARELPDRNPDQVLRG